MAELEKLDDNFTITINETDHTIFMSYALKNKLVSLMQEATDVASVMSDPSLQMTVLSEVLARRREDGKIVEQPFDFENDKFPEDQLYELLAWIVQHVLNFFAQGFNQTMALAERAKQQAEQLDSEQSNDGSKT